MLAAVGAVAVVVVGLGMFRLDACTTACDFGAADAALRVTVFSAAGILLASIIGVVVASRRGRRTGWIPVVGVFTVVVVAVVAWVVVGGVAVGR